MKKVLLITILGLLVLCNATSVSSQSDEDDSKITIFVSKFQDSSGETGRSWWYGAGIQDVGESFREYVKNALLATGQFRVFDFEKTAEETEELNQIAAATNPDAAIDQSQLAMHAYVIEGAIVNVNSIQKGSGAIGALLGAYTGVGGDRKLDIITVTVTVNMRDQKTGETLFSEKLTGEKKRETYVIITDQGAAGSGSSGERAGDVGYAMEDAANKILDFVLEKFPIQGTILKVTDDRKYAYVDLGSKHGLKEGDLLTIVEMQEVDLGFEIIYEAKEVGYCVVAQVIDETHCKVAKKKGELVEGATVQVSKKKKD
jgi:curli biogenesis system outer membrane secretion channel CsgG